MNKPNCKCRYSVSNTDVKTTSYNGSLARKRVSCLPFCCEQWMWQLCGGRKRKVIRKTLLLPYLQRASKKKKKYLTCKVPPLHRSFPVLRVYLFFHLICIMYFLCIAHSDDSSFLYTYICVHIYICILYICICACAI